MTQLSPHEIEVIASKAATEAVERVLLAMGVDMSDPKAILEMQKDFAHTRESRLAIAAIKTKAYLVSTGIVITGVLAAVWLSIKGH